MDLFLKNPLENVYILLQTLDYLPVEDVKICRLVNTTWNIEATKILKKKTLIKLSGLYPHPYRPDILEYMGHFQHPNLFLDNPEFDDGDDEETFVNFFIPGIKYLKYRLESKSDEEESENGVQLFYEVCAQSAPTLEELVFDYAPDYSKPLPRTLCPQVVFEKIKSFKFLLEPPPSDGDSAELFRTILEVLPNLEKLKLETHHSFEVYAAVLKDYAQSEKGLSSSFATRLKHLSISDEYDDRAHAPRLRFSSLIFVPWKLTKLRIHFLSVDEDSILLELINQQAPTLRKLAISVQQGFYNVHAVFPSIICKIPVSKMSKVGSSSNSFIEYEILLPKKLEQVCNVKPISSLSFNSTLNVVSQSDCPKFRFYIK